MSNQTQEAGQPTQETMPLRCGGINETVKEMTEEVTGHTVSLQEHVHTKLGRELPVFEPVVYTTQLVNGVNYFVKVRTGNEEHIHVRFHRARSGELTLSNVQEGHTAESAVEYFE